MSGSLLLVLCWALLAGVFVAARWADRDRDPSPWNATAWADAIRRVAPKDVPATDAGSTGPDRTDETPFAPPAPRFVRPRSGEVASTPGVPAGVPHVRVITGGGNGSDSGDTSADRPVARLGH